MRVFENTSKHMWVFLLILTDPQDVLAFLSFRQIYLYVLGFLMYYFLHLTFPEQVTFIYCIILVGFCQ